MPIDRRLAVIGGGWAGLTAAIEATRLGYRVTVFEMAKQLGGRARSVMFDGLAFDNGQHICIGAYRETLRLLADVGVAESLAFLRTPLDLSYPNGESFTLRSGPPAVAFLGAVWRHAKWSWEEKLSLLTTTARWLGANFQCDPTLTVAQLSARLPAVVQRELIEPLCVAALNTPADAASATVFLRVLSDALFSGRGAADFLLPRVGLGDLLPLPADRWLRAHGSTLLTGRRVEMLERVGRSWLVDGDPFDALVVAASATEAARLVSPFAADWAQAANALVYEPIVTAYLQSDGTTLPKPMLALHADATAPAQFVFDRGQLGGPAGLLAFVVSGAAAWTQAGAAATLEALCQQAKTQLGALLRSPLQSVQLVNEKRATFRCTPSLARPPTEISSQLVAAGDYVGGPYPATLEGAVRSGLQAARALT